MSKKLILKFIKTEPKIEILGNESERLSQIDNSEDLYDLVELIDKKLRLNLGTTTELDFVRNAYHMAEQGIVDDTIDYTDLDVGDKTNFGLSELIHDELSKKIIMHKDFSLDSALSDKVINELEKNQKLDTLAYMIDLINTAIVAKLIELYYLNKANSVIFEDSIGLIRLQEILGKELSRQNILFKIINQFKS